MAPIFRRQRRRDDPPGRKRKKAGHVKAREKARHMTGQSDKRKTWRLANRERSVQYLKAWRAKKREEKQDRKSMKRLNAARNEEKQDEWKPPMIMKQRTVLGSKTYTQLRKGVYDMPVRRAPPTSSKYLQWHYRSNRRNRLKRKKVCQIKAALRQAPPSELPAQLIWERLSAALPKEPRTFNFRPTQDDLDEIARIEALRAYERACYRRRLARYEELTITSKSDRYSLRHEDPSLNLTLLGKPHKRNALAKGYKPTEEAKLTKEAEPTAQVPERTDDAKPTIQTEPTDKDESSEEGESRDEDESSEHADTSDEEESTTCYFEDDGAAWSVMTKALQNVQVPFELPNEWLHESPELNASSPESSNVSNHEVPSQRLVVVPEKTIDKISEKQKQHCHVEMPFGLPIEMLTSSYEAAASKYALSHIMTDKREDVMTQFWLAMESNLAECASDFDMVHDTFQDATMDQISVSPQGVSSDDEVVTQEVVPMVVKPPQPCEDVRFIRMKEADPAMAASLDVLLEKHRGVLWKDQICEFREEVVINI
ncbi:hypothetical protein LEN26_006372 [Aphanomyces euteiches]|nr:hypothetical protein LEN26_006372 [Aphanomyces euteiches]